MEALWKKVIPGCLCLLALTLFISHTVFGKTEENVNLPRTDMKTKAMVVVSVKKVKQADGKKVKVNTIEIDQKAVVDRLENLVKTGQWNQSRYAGMCLKFVADFWAAQGATRDTAPTAMIYARQHVQSRSMKNIPIGADVYFDYTKWHGTKAGHIGIYVGNDTFICAFGPQIVAYKWSDVRTVYRGHAYTWRELFWGWGYHGNVTVVS